MPNAIFGRCYPIDKPQRENGLEWHYFDAQMTCGALSRVCRSQSNRLMCAAAAVFERSMQQAMAALVDQLTYVRSRSVPSPAGSRAAWHRSYAGFTAHAV
jgi:hypothetical protein